MCSHKCAENQNLLASGICRHMLLTRFQKREEHSRTLVIALYLLCWSRAIKFLLKSTGPLQGATYFLSGWWMEAIAWEIVVVLQIFVLNFLQWSKVFQISVANSFLCAGLALETVPKQEYRTLSAGI